MQRGDYLLRKFSVALLTLAVVIVFNFPFGVDQDGKG